MLLEGVARPLLVVHALVGATLVATTTHHLIWTIRSRGARRRGEPRFALLASLFFVLSFSFGCLLYPTYRIRVRAQLFDSRDAAIAERALRPESNAPLALPRVARLFDVKEHMAALGLLASAALFWLSRRVSPEMPESRPLYLALAWFCCSASWTAAVIGIYTASVRAVGSL